MGSDTLNVIAADAILQRSDERLAQNLYPAQKTSIQTKLSMKRRLKASASKHTTQTILTNIFGDMDIPEDLLQDTAVSAKGLACISHFIEAEEALKREICAKLTGIWISVAVVARIGLGKRGFCAGLTLVALSRATTITGIMFDEHFDYSCMQNLGGDSLVELWMERRLES
jgi:hypothetical protein